MCRIEYTKVTNKVFYGLNGDMDRGLIMDIKDGTVIHILHRLYALTNRENNAYTTLDSLIEECGYKTGKENKLKFKNILAKLKEYNIINFKEVPRSTDLMIINTENICEKDGFTIILDEELELISNNSKDKREFNNTIKVYFYLKARCFKRGTELAYDGGRAETTYCSYENISKYTMVSEGKIKDYIDLLSKLGLIIYSSSGKKYKVDNPNSLTECANVYALTKISGNDFVKDELKEGLKQQKYDYEQKGFKITKKDYKDNNRQINGRKGYLIKKQNNNTLTEEEKEELNNIVSSQDNNSLLDC